MFKKIFKIIVIVSEFAEECHETIRQVSEFWDAAVIRIRNKNVKEDKDDD